MTRTWGAPRINRMQAILKHVGQWSRGRSESFFLAALVAVSSATAVLADGQGGNGWTDDVTPQEVAGAVAAPTTGEALMADCLARLPVDPVSMVGRLTMRRPRGMVSKEFDFRVDLNWGAVPPTARYTISESKGAVLETVIARGGDAPELVRAVGPQSEPAQPPEWNDRIQGSDVAWLDVTLGFLWWKSPRWVGEATVKGYHCDIVELVPPTPVPNCAKVRVWIDRELKLLVQAEEVDPAGRVTRQMWVRAVKKIRDRWMVRDLEVQTRSSGHRTRLHVADVVEAGSR